jgi:hypothetical protein
VIEATWAFAFNSFGILKIWLSRSSLLLLRPHMHVMDIPQDGPKFEPKRKVPESSVTCSVRFRIPVVDKMAAQTLMLRIDALCPTCSLYGPFRSAEVESLSVWLFDGNLAPDIVKHIPSRWGLWPWTGRGRCANYDV